MRGLANFIYRQSPIINQEKEGFPMRVEAKGRTPLLGDICREDIYRFFRSCNITKDDVS